MRCAIQIDVLPLPLPLPSLLYKMLALHSSGARAETSQLPLFGTSV